MKSKGSIFILLSILCIASIDNMPSVLSSSYGDSQRGSCTYCTEVSSKTTFEDPDDCPEEYDCTGTRVKGYVANKSTGDTLDIIILYNECDGSVECRFNHFKDFYSSSDCVEKTY